LNQKNLSESILVNVGQNRLEQFQFLRFIAFCLVFALHIGEYQLPWFPGGYGAACSVSFFFILSGFLSGWTSYDKKVRCSMKEIGKYLWKKIRKLYPLYFFTTLFALMYTGFPVLIARHEFSAATPIFMSLVRSLLLLQSWFPQGFFDFNGVGWFVSTIFFLYALNVPLRFWMGKIRENKNPTVLYLIIFFLSAGISVLYCYLTRNTNTEYTQYVFPPARVWEYVCGMTLGCMIRHVNRREKWNATSTVVFSAAEIAAFIFWFVSMYLPMEGWQFRIVHWLIPNFLLIGVFSFGRGLLSKLFRLRFLRYLGDISFECFLLHLLVIRSFNLNSGYGAISTLGNLFEMSYCLILTILLSALISKVKYDQNKAKEK